MSAKVMAVSDGSIKVGPLPGPSESYAYRIGRHESLHKYHNAASAWADARRPQIVREDGKVEPYERAKKFDRANA
jgi:hypothetical protein